MEGDTPAALVQSPEGVLGVLLLVVTFFFFLERKTRWKLFEYFPPLIFIYATPVLLNNGGVLSSSSPVYGVLRQFGLPVFICLMLISVDVGAAVRIMGKGIAVMLLGTVGIVVGGVVAYAIVHRWLDEDAWTGFGALAGSWIGGTGNMAAVAEMVGTSEEQFGLAVIADNLVYIVWLPILLGSKTFAERFNRWTKVPEGRLEAMEAAAAGEKKIDRAPDLVDYLYLAMIAITVAWVSSVAAEHLPELGDVISTSTWRILLITTFSIALSFTPAKRIPGSHGIAMALIYVYVASMGARASLAGFDQAPAFLFGAFIWIFIHGAFTLLGAKLFRIDVHSVAIASAANVGGAASAPVVAAAHRESLVPASILMALIGYALGTYLALLTAHLCRWVGS